MSSPMRVDESSPGSPWRHAIDGSRIGMENGKKSKYAQVLVLQHNDRSQEPSSKMKYSPNSSHIHACTMFSKLTNTSQRTVQKNELCANFTTAMTTRSR